MMNGASRVLTLGPVAGLVGTAVMTLSQRVEMRASKRSPSTVPGQVGARLLGRDDPADVERLSPIAHWTHGATMGAARGLLGSIGLRGPAGTAAFFAVLWSGDALLYKSLGIADWPWRWTARDLATDVGHKAIYAAITGLVYDKLSGEAGDQSRS